MFSNSFSIALDSTSRLAATVSHAWRVFRKSGMEGLYAATMRRLNKIGPPSNDERGNYSLWVRRYDSMTWVTRNNALRHMRLFDARPKISLILWSEGSHINAHVNDSVASVQSQLYPDWELYVVCDSEAWTSQKFSDERIKWVNGAVDTPLADVMNRVVGLSSGSWVGTLMSGDRISRCALFWLVKAINCRPEAKFIYSDEDLIDSGGFRVLPNFKPDWDIELIRSRGSVGDLAIFRKDVICELGGWRSNLNGAELFDLVLRCAEHVKPSDMVHVSRVLYHARQGLHDATDIKASNYLQVLQEHVLRIGLSANVSRTVHGFRVRYNMPYQMPMVSLVIPTRNALDLVKVCIDSILNRTDYTNYEILLVDNGSDDEGAIAYFDGLTALPNVRVVRDDREFNYSALNNSAVALAKGSVIGLVNNDVEIISSDWLTEMVSIAMQPDVGAVGARLWYPDKTLQHGGVVLAGVSGIGAHLHKGLKEGRPGYFGRAVLTQSVSAVTAACLLIRKDTYLSVGGLDERLKVAFNDVDFCLRVKAAGYRNVWTPYAELFHYESATRGEDLTPEKKARFQSEVAFMARRWGTLLEEDPAYNRNLTIQHDDFSFAWPPRHSSIEHAESFVFK